ncbi:4660_t:CDS:2 [Ambispora gerdemannii]|uniref:4660_t:CDS:1 n=1 Tax=Ambispora gerdemannii TaxID=144530 RepID=A0A9N8ZT16_9GLOM|nr:4660_t:CDS:2 [Ambispora gerdemannii]
MSPNKFANINPSNLSIDIMNSYIVHVGEQTFRLYRSSITCDSPNFFTEAFLGEETSEETTTTTSKINSNVTTAVESNATAAPALEENGDAEKSIVNGGDALSGSVVSNTESPNVTDKANSNNGTSSSNKNSSIRKEIAIDRDPRLFEVILRYLRGYTIFPLSSVNLPPGMSLDLFRESLLEDARFYRLDQLAQLLQAETPTPLRYKDPFTSQDKILLSLRDVPIHKDFIKSKLEGPSAIEFFTGAVLTLELDNSDATIQFHTEFLNDHDQKALQTIGEICGENTQIQLSHLMTTGWNMRDALNGIRLEIDGVQVTGVDIASLVGSFNPRVKALDDMFRLAGGQKLVIYAQEFVFRLEYRTAASDVTDSSSINGTTQINGSRAASINEIPAISSLDTQDSSVNPDEETENNSQAGGESNDGSSDTVDEIVWAKGWTQEWWAWNEYRMKLDTLQ